MYFYFLLGRQTVDRLQSFIIEMSKVEELKEFLQDFEAHDSNYEVGKHVLR